MIKRENNKGIQNTVSNLGQGIGDGKLKQWISNTGARHAAKKVKKDYEKHGTCYGESCAKSNFHTKGSTGLTANKKGGKVGQVVGAVLGAAVLPFSIMTEKEADHSYKYDNFLTKGLTKLGF